MLFSIISLPILNHLNIVTSSEFMQNLSQFCMRQIKGVKGVLKYFAFPYLLKLQQQ